LDALLALDALYALRALSSGRTGGTCVALGAGRPDGADSQLDGRLPHLAVVALDLPEAAHGGVQGRQNVVELNVELVAGVGSVRLLDRMVRKVVIPFVRIRRLRHIAI
jgi:hypothetical protein